MNSRPQIVISRFSENLDWLHQWSEVFDILVYNKGAEEVTEFHSERLPNWGREAHTYLFHLFDKYDLLSEITLFLQGDISDIGVNVFSDLNEYVRMASKTGFAASNLGMFNETIWNDIDFMSDPRYRAQIDSGFLRRSEIRLKDFVTHHVGRIPVQCPACWCGCFAVHRIFAQSRPREFYLNLLKAIPEYHSPEEAHFLERMWALIFTDGKWNY